MMNGFSASFRHFPCILAHVWYTRLSTKIDMYDTEHGPEGRRIATLKRLRAHCTRHGGRREALLRMRSDFERSLHGPCRGHSSSCLCAPIRKPPTSETHVETSRC